MQISDILDQFIGPQHPLLGICEQRITTELTLDNWQHKAILLPGPNGQDYVFINRASRAKHRQTLYCVTRWPLAGEPATEKVIATFVTPEDAIAWLRVRRHGAQRVA